MKHREATTTLLVHEALTFADDFMTPAQLVFVTGRSPNHVCAALCHLKKHRAADFVHDIGGTFWFATGDDSRIRVVRERANGEKRSRRKKNDRTLQA